VRIVVLGYVVRGPLGGLAWHYLQYVLGLQKLGHDVAFIEDSGDDEWCCYDPLRGVTDSDPTYGLEWATRLFASVDLQSWAYFDSPTGGWHGPLADSAVAFCSTADAVLNISGSNVIRPWTALAPVRAFIDTDPVFTQVRNLTDPTREKRALDHNAFFTFGENFGTLATIPDDGHPWLPTRQPVVLDMWAPGSANAGTQLPYTTLMQWDSYDGVDYAGRHFGMKSESFGPYADLPSRVDVELAAALGSPSAPRDWLRDLGWKLEDPFDVAPDAWAFRDYVQSSRGEFSVAKHGYVEANSGWFSERSANYLASGRPVIVQDTGFEPHIRAGLGLLTFGSPEEAIEALCAVESDYEMHARAARAVAVEYFASDVVLGSLVSRLSMGKRDE
jgi:hypothetical protein